MNASVAEGNTASFTCVPKVDNVVGLSVWVIQPVAGAGVTARLDNATNLNGASGVFVSPDRTQLLITGVQNSLHLTEVMCRGTNANATLTPVFADTVYILVLSKSYHRYYMYVP